jgi:dTDP-4-dehydrorhamnose 3,5-epimerase
LGAAGFAHGFLSLQDGTEFLYKCNDFYVPEDEHALLWSDPETRIEWPLDGSSRRFQPRMWWEGRW